MSAFLRVLLLACCATSSLARGAPPERFLIAIGNDVGAPEETPLKFASADARRVYTVLTELGGVDSSSAELLLNTTAPEVRRRLAEIRSRLELKRRQGVSLVLLVYVSAHGRAGQLHLAGTELSLSELTQWMQGTGAELRLLLVDACESGTAARNKGGRPGPEYEIRLDRGRLRGQVVVTSSGPAEPSQEWASLGGSLFTHHLVTGLRGDADTQADGQVSLSEVYSYAYRRTVSDAAGQEQTPSFEFDLAGDGDWILTQPGRFRTALVFPAETEGRFVVSSRPRADVVSQVVKLPGRVLRLAVPAGKYQVRKLLGREVGLLEVDLPYGGEAILDESKLVRHAFSEVAIKGGELELHPNALLLLGQWQSEELAGTGGRWKAGLGYRRTFGPEALLFSLVGNLRSFRGRELSVEERSLTFELAYLHSFVLGPLRPFLGAAAQGTSVWQRFSRDREEEIRVIYGEIPSVWGASYAAGLKAGLEVPLPWSFFLHLAGDFQVRYQRTSVQPPWTVGLSGGAGLGWVF